MKNACTRLSPSDIVELHRPEGPNIGVNMDPLIPERFNKLLHQISTQFESIQPTFDALRRIGKYYEGLKDITVNVPDVPFPLTELKTLGVKLEEPRDLTAEENAILADAMWSIGIVTYISAAEDRDFDSYSELIKTILARKDAQLQELYGE